VGGAFTNTGFERAILVDDRGVTGIPHTSGNVFAVAASPTYYAIGGSFTGGVLIRTRSATTWTNLSTDASVLALLFVPPSTGFPQGRLIAGGSFTTPFPRIAQYDLATSTWLSLGTSAGASAAVNALAVGPDGQIYAGGAFSSIGGVSANGIARWDGTTWQPLGAGVNSSVTAMRFQGQFLYVAGAFTTAGGNAVTGGVARWDGSWSGLPNFVNPGTSNALVFDRDGVLYVGITTSPWLLRWDGTATAELTGLNSQVFALEVAPNGTSIYVGSSSTVPSRLSLYDGYRFTAVFAANNSVRAIAQVPPISPLAVRSAIGITSVGAVTVSPSGLLDVSGNAALDGTVSDAGFSGLLSATVANMAPRPGTSLLLAERFCRWMQYVTSRSWREESYVDQPAWWSQWMLSGRDGAATGALSWVTYSGPAAASFIGGVLLPDGRALSVPETASAIGVFNYVTNTWATYTKPSGSFIGACLLPDGRALMVPSSATSISVFDYRTNTSSEVVTGVGTQTDKYYTACVLPDGRVLIPSRVNTNDNLIFDYRTDSVQTVLSGIGTGQTSTLMPDGRVFCYLSSTTLRTFNYTDNSYTTYTSPSLGNTYASALMPDGRVLYASGRTVASFDYRTNTSLLQASYGSTGDSIGTLSTLPDGRVLAALLAVGSGTFGAFDYRTNTWTTYTGTGSAYWGAVCLPDGRTMLVPRNVAHVAVVSVAGVTRAPSLDFCYHPCFNQAL
jgi:hypothetical protein